jgi:hypothetical protein
MFVNLKIIIKGWLRRANHGYEIQSKLWKNFAASCWVLYPPLRRIIRLTLPASFRSFSASLITTYQFQYASRFRNWSFTINNGIGQYSNRSNLTIAKKLKGFNHGYEPRSKLRGIKPSAARDCSTYQFRYASLSELEFQQ